jgi:MFS family permease
MCQLTSIPFYLTMVCGIEDKEGYTPYQVAIAPACSFVASFLYSIFVMDRL